MCITHSWEEERGPVSLSLDLVIPEIVCGIEISMFNFLGQKRWLTTFKDIEDK